MKKGLLVLAIISLLMTAYSQSGRVPRGGETETPTSRSVLPLDLDSARPVLVNMRPREFQSCGLNKLSDEELDHLDRWFLDLLVKLQSLPAGKTLKFEAIEADQVRERERQRQQLEARLNEFQSSLLVVSQEARRMSFDLRSAKMATSRGDWGGVHTSLLRLESSLRRIEQVTH